MKLGKVYTSLKKYADALKCFKEAQKTIEGDNSKALIKELIENANYYSHNP